MRALFIILFSFISIHFSAQSEVIKLGILPSTYGDGMPLAEFAEFEKNVFKYLKNIERYKIVRGQAAFEAINIEIENGRLKINSEDFSEKIGAHYLLQLAFGDTDWTSNTDTRPNTSSTFRPPTSPVAYGHSATVWLTLNIYDIATGTLENSITLTANSSERVNHKKGNRPPQNVFKQAVSNAQKALWAKTKKALQTLLPLNLSIEKIIEQDGNKAKKVLINGGSFHGLKSKESIYVFYEKEYIIRGKSTMRFVEVAKLSLEKVNSKTSIGKVRKGQKAITKALEEGKNLKCIIKNQNQYSKGYGF